MARRIWPGSVRAGVRWQAVTKYVLPFLLAVVLIAFEAITVSAHRVRDCELEIAAAVDDLGVDRRSVTDIEIWHEDAGGSEGGRQGYLAYILLKSCEGYLMVSTSTSCQVLQVYTSGRCKLPGVPHFR